MRPRKPKRRVYRKLDPNFASDYIKVLRSLGRQHKDDDTGVVRGALRVLRKMSQETFLAGRGELWIPQPHRFSGYYPIMEKIPYTQVRKAIRKNTSEAERARSWGVVAASAEPFLPLRVREPGTLNTAQRRSLLEHAEIALPHIRGRYPALLGKRVPGAEGSDIVKSRSLIPARSGQLAQVMAPEDWEKGFTMKKFALSRKQILKVKALAIRDQAKANLRDAWRQDPAFRRALVKRWAALTAGAVGISLLARLLVDKRKKPSERASKRKFSLSEDLAKSISRMRTATPRVPNPKPHPPKVDLKDTLKKAVDTKIKLEPERREYAGELAVRSRRPMRSVTQVKARIVGPHRRVVASRWMRRHRKLLHGGAFLAGLGGASAVGAALAAKRRRKQQQHDYAIPEWYKPEVKKLLHTTVPRAELGARSLRARKEIASQLHTIRVRARYPHLGIPKPLLERTLPHSDMVRKMLKRRRVGLGTLSAATLVASPLIALAVRKHLKRKQQYTLSATDRMCYDDGVREWMERTGRRTKRLWRRTKQWVKRDVLPTALRGATMGVATLAQTEVGMGPTTIDLLPVQRVGLKRDLQPYPSNQLRGVVQGLQASLVSEVDPVLRKGLEKGISEIATELMIRKTML